MARKINALLIDDSRTTRKMIMAALEQTGLADFTFTEAEDGVDALSKFRAGETQIMFVDMNMPRLDGIGFIRKLHSLHQDCPPAVMITAETSQERLKEAVTEAGVDAFLMKPVDRDRLRAGLKTIIDAIPEPAGPCVVPYGECVAEATQDMIGKLCDMQLVAEDEDEAVRSGNIVLGMISILGDVQWSVVLGFTREAAAGAASKFAGCEIPPDSPEMGDAIGEIANIVGGRAKQILSSQALNVSISLPTVISAAEFKILIQRKRKTSAAYSHFNSPVGKLWCEVTVGLHAGMVL